MSLPRLRYSSGSRNNRNEMNKLKGLPRKNSGERNPFFTGRGLATGIGSLPYTAKDFACRKILQYFPQLPYWPQLPKISFRENMCVQYSEGLPGIIVNEKEEKVYLEENEFNRELETFYQNYLTRNLDYFTISEKYAAGFYAFCSLLKKEKLNSLGAVKGQITGPLTFGLSVKDENGRSIFYNEQMRDVLIKHLQMKALWQISQLLTINSQLATILFLDEPYLAAYGNAYTAISREEVISSLSEVVSGIKNYQSPNHLITQLPVVVGVHCCANTDWSIVLESGIELLSFDAYDYFDSLLLYREAVKKFIENDGILAWGIVPTDEKVLNESVDSLKKKFLHSLEQLVKNGIEEKKLLANFLLTPSCGLGTKSEPIAEKALLLTSELSKTLTK